jgi:hypothetical protein
MTELVSVRGAELSAPPESHNMSKNLSDTQRVILASAAAHQSGRVLPTPSSLAKNPGAIALSLKATLAAGLLSEVPAGYGDTPYGTAADGLPTTLIVSPAGLAAIGITPDFSPHAVTEAPVIERKSARAGSKLDLLCRLLRAPGGATISELALETGWQRHSVRGALSGALKRKLALVITSELTQDRGRVYAMVQPSAVGPRDGPSEPESATP